VFGVKPTYGSDAALMGMEANLSGAGITLAAGETIIQAQYKGGAK